MSKDSQSEMEAAKLSDSKLQIIVGIFRLSVEEGVASIDEIISQLGENLENYTYNATKLIELLKKIQPKEK